MPEFKTPSELYYAYRTEQRSFYCLLLFGVFILALSIYEYKAGKVWEKFRGWVLRSEHPIIFWVDVLGGIFSGIGVIGYTLYHLWTLTPP